MKSTRWASGYRLSSSNESFSYRDRGGANDVLDQQQGRLVKSITQITIVQRRWLGRHVCGALMVRMMAMVFAYEC